MPADRYPRMKAIFNIHFSQDHDLWGNTIEEIIACYKRDSPREWHFELIHEIDSFMSAHAADLDIAYNRDYGSHFDPQLWGHTSTSFLEALKRMLAAQSSSATEVLQERQAGEVRISIIRDYSDDLSIVLKKVGLDAPASCLVECNRSDAIEILTGLLWKDQAYGHECMPEARAKFLAEKVVLENGYENSRYFSNKTSPTADSWRACTESTFDCGLIISSGDGRYFCIWFEDED